MFTCNEGRVLVGADISGLEVRLFAHYANDKNYIDTILNSDIHTFNMNAAGLQTRDQSKTFLYALLFGAGVTKLGSITGGGQKQGKALQDKFFSEVPSIKKLIDKCIRWGKENGSMPLIDGRVAMLRKFEGRIAENRCLNTLLQGSGAVISKYWLVEVDNEVRKRGLDSVQVMWTHDDQIRDTLPEHADEVCQIMHESIKKVGEMFNLRIPMEVESKIGRTLSDVH
jgi:DNA polymerase I-like protein with 3'-5' exonuclease and polymerase domains